GISAGTGKLSRPCATLSEFTTVSTARRCAVRGTHRSIPARAAANGAVVTLRALPWCKGRHPRDITSNDQRLDRIRSLVRKHRLDISMVPGNMIFQQDAIATEHLAGISNDFTREPGIVHFGE